MSYPIPPQVAKPSPSTDAIQTTRLDLFALEDLQYLDQTQAGHCQELLGNGIAFGVWNTPESLVPHIGKSTRKVELSKRILAYLPPGTNPTSELNILVDEGVLWLTRLAILMRTGPAGVGKTQHQRLDASTVASTLHSRLTKIVARGIVRRMADPLRSIKGFAAALNAEDIREFRASRHMKNELRRLTALRDKGLWSDVVPTTVFHGKTTCPRGKQQSYIPEQKSTPYESIPDDYLATMGPRILWIIHDLGPNMINLLESLPERLASINFLSETEANSKKTTRQLAKYFEENAWTDRNGDPIIRPPFPLFHGSYRGKNKATKQIDPYEWPIRTWASVANLALTLQSAHLWVTLLMLAGRSSEIMTLPRDCIEIADDGHKYVNGKTYKLKFALDGERRQWPAPDILIGVLAQQVQLLDACERLARLKRRADPLSLPIAERDYLWASLGSSPRSNPEARLGVINTALKNLAIRVGMTPTPGGKNLHAHRFRKTVARLAGLAIEGSPKILMKLLGHKEITMTLGYILSNPTFSKEIDDIARELRVMRTEGLVEDMHNAMHTGESLSNGGHGGAGAAALSTAIRNFEEGLHRTGKMWDVDTAHELAVLLSNNGQSMRLVSAHVICTKTETELGLCSPRKGAANTGNCHSECIRRIEEKTSRRDTRKIIPIIVTNAQKAVKDNDLLVLASYARQLKVEINRFDDIATEWYMNADVKEIMEALK